MPEYVPFHERPMVYVAGPYTRPDPVQNTHDTIHEANAIEDYGSVTCFIPHLTLLHHLVDPKPLEHWYEHDLATMARCDAVYRRPGDSTGADGEVAYAIEKGIPVFYDVPSVLDWADKLISASHV